MGNKLKSLMVAVMLSTAIVTPSIVLTGCTTTQQQITYNTLATIGQSVDAAMKAYAQLYVQGKVTLDQWNNVAKIYETYRGIYNAALVTAQNIPTAPASPDVTSAATAVINATKGL